MKKIGITLILTLQMLVFAPQKVNAQQALTTEGKEFWLAFMHNGLSDTTHLLELYITSKVSTTGTVTFPKNQNCLNCTQTFSVNANSTTIVNIPLFPGHTIDTLIQNTGIKVTANDDISVFAINTNKFTTDASVVLPKKSLGTQSKYLISDYDNGLNSNQYIIVGVEDSSEIRITDVNNSITDIILDAGETYLVKKNNFTGTSIESVNTCKPFAVFSGSICTRIPLGCWACDHLFTQEYPITTWGHDYLLTPFSGMPNGYQTRILAVEDGSIVDAGGIIHNLNAGQYVDININTLSDLCIKSNQPISVAQYMLSSNCNGIFLGDPAKLMTNPIDQFVESAIFNTVSTPSLSSHFVTIITKTNATNQVYLDSVLVDSTNFQTASSCSDYSYTMLPIVAGSHQIKSDSGFIAYAYGYGHTESYAYSVGASFENIQYGFTTTQDTGCLKKPIHFAAFGKDITSYEWDFGDGSPVLTDAAVSHTYTIGGDYDVKLMITKLGSCSVDTIVKTVKINLPILSKSVTQPTCFNSQNGTITINVTNAVAPYTFDWNIPQTSNVLTGLGAGNYILEVTDSLGCQQTDTISLNSPNPIIHTINQTICDNEIFIAGGISHTITGTYTYNLQTPAGCDSLVTLNLLVHPTKTTTIDTTICDNQIVIAGGINHNTTGSYTYNLQTSRGCDSVVTLNLLVYPTKTTTIDTTICDNEIVIAGGINHNTTGTYTYNLQTSESCDSIVTLNLLVHPTKTAIIDTTICSGNLVIAGGVNHTTTGSYTYTFQTLEGCDSVVTLNLLVHPAKMITIDTAICDNEIFVAGGVNHTVAGSYTYNLQTLTGCDSIVTLNLLVYPTKTTTIDTTICNNQAIIAGGVSHNTTGIYTYNLQTDKGCDSIVTLNLLAHPAKMITIDTTICDNQAIIAGGISHNTTGIYIYNLQTSKGCDSTVTLNLLVHPTKITTIDTTICDNQIMIAGNISHNLAGTYTYNLQTSNGCDSIVTLNLLVHPTKTTTIDTIICDNEIVIAGDINHNTTGTYTYNLQTSEGCDSIVVLNLLVHPTKTTTIDTTICDNETFIASGINHNTTGSYTYNLQTNKGCDSIVVLNLLVNPTKTTTIDTTICEGSIVTAGGIDHVITGTHTYILQTWQGCDSTIILNLLVNPTYDINRVDTICQGEMVTIGQQTFNETGHYVIPLISQFGCDSIIDLTLMVIPLDTTYEVIKVCDESFVRDTMIIYPNQYGCDSMVVTNWILEDGFLNFIDTTICENTTYTLELDSMGIEFLWQDGSTTSTYDITEAGTYSVMIRRADGCLDVDTFEIMTLSPPIDGNWITDTTLCEGNRITFNATTDRATNYQWEGESTHFGQNNYNDALFTMVYEGLYSVTVSNRCGGFTHNIDVTVEDCSCDPFIPDAFTPNNDGINDRFQAYSNCLNGDYELRILDRWGNLLFTSKDKNEGWDGVFNGQKMPIGVYIYQVTFEAMDNRGELVDKVKSGDFTLIR